MGTDPQSLTRTFEATMAEFPAMNGFVEQAATAAGFGRSLANKILLAAEEVLTNVIHYAYQGGKGTLTITCSPPSGRRGLCVTIEDSGLAFNPLERADPDITVPLEERPIGGLGILVVKRTMDEVRYERVHDRNVLTMTKYLP